MYSPLFFLNVRMLAQSHLLLMGLPLFIDTETVPFSPPVKFMYPRNNTHPTMATVPLTITTLFYEEKMEIIKKNAFKCPITFHTCTHMTYMMGKETSFETQKVNEDSLPSTGKITTFFL